jgi:hypothetical protein
MIYEAKVSMKAFVTETFKVSLSFVDRVIVDMIVFCSRY